MIDLLFGPLFFIAGVAVLLLGVGLLGFLARQGWWLMAVAFLMIGIAVPGVLTVVGVLGCICCVSFYLRWRKMGIGGDL